MERMAASLSEVVPILLESHGSKTKSAKVPMGDVAIAMLNCLEAMHVKGYVFIDVKPENFMLAAASSSSKKSKKTLNDVSQRIRLIDFGLVEQFGDMSVSKHRENMHPDAALIGTPTYASLNIMSGHTPSRRDDLEALWYVVCELILMLGSSSSGKGKGKKKDGNVLPWSHAASDSDVYKIKLQETDKSKRSKSKLFAALKAGGADKVMDKYFTTVRDVGYSDKPDYEVLRTILKKLTVTVGSIASPGGVKKAASSASPKKQAAKSPVRRSGRRKHEEDEDDEEDSDTSMEIIEDENVDNGKKKSSKKVAGKKQKVSVATESAPRRTTSSTRPAPKTREMSTQTDPPEVINIDSSDEEDESTMEWEKVGESESDEEEEVGVNAPKNGILKLDILEGPHQGEEVFIGGDHPDTILIGKDADSHAMKDATKFALSKDDAASGALAKIVLNSKSNVHSVKITSMASNGIEVKNCSLAKGKYKQAFLGDRLKLGDSLIQIRRA